MFILFSATRNFKQIKTYLAVLFVVVLVVILYGYGQKYMGLPAFSTMNREFSKGIKLYLTEHSRVISTFGGHYDLAAFSMMTLLLGVSLAVMTKKIWLKLVLWPINGLNYWLLILTVSRTSFGAFLAGLGVLFFVLAFKKGVLWSLFRWLVITAACITVAVFFGDMSDRMTQVISGMLLKGNIKIAHLEKKQQRPVAKSDQPPVTEEEMVIEKVGDRKGQVPADVEFEAVKKRATKSAETNEPMIEIEYPTYSENALKYGLSTAIRLDALWPRAWQGFKRNPLLGSGYSTLVKEKVEEFTQAESTDNDYLRLLGETGLLGFTTYLSIFVIMAVKIVKEYKKTKDSFLLAVLAAGLAMIVGLIINAAYIDVFEASKVAYFFWAFAGILIAAINLNRRKAASGVEKTF